MSTVRQTLYRKYRPQRFSELVGQEVVATTLRNSVREGRLGHAYLFTGIRGTGKTSAARILARAINCERPEQGEPCGECQPCVSIADQASLDVIEIDAATNRGIDEIRDLRERVQFRPSQLRTKVYIIDEAHMLTADASNAFLKTLEEPPEHACFILATTEPQRMVETVRSRCQRFDFRRIPVEAMTRQLAWICAQEGVEASSEALTLVSEAAAGSLRDALSLLDRLIGLADGALDLTTAQAGLGMADPGALLRLARELAAGRVGAAWLELHQLQAGGAEPRQLARSLGALARDLLWRELSPAGSPPGPDPEVVPPAPPGFWLKLMAMAAAAGTELRRADDPWMALEARLLGLGSSPVAPVQDRPQEPVPATAPPASAPAAPVTSAEELPDIQMLKTTDPVPSREPDPPVAEPAEAAGALIPTAPGAVGGVERWPEIMSWLGRENVPVQALMKEGRPVRHADGVLVVEFDQKGSFHLGRMQSPVNRQLLERACLAVLGEPVEVQMVEAAPVDGDPRGAQDGTPAEAGPDAAPDLGQAMAVFPGSRVTRLGTDEKR